MPCTQFSVETTLAISILGKDKPGLVESVASVVTECGGNWLESRMCHLGGQFAGILQVDTASAHVDAIIEGLKGLEKEGLSVLVHPESEDNAQDEATSRLKLDVIGQDRAGIVQSLSRCIAARNINVEELNTGTQNAAMSGEALFCAQAVLSIPQQCDLAEFKSSLEQIANDLMVDVSFED